MKDVRQLGCVLQHLEPPESSAILRKDTIVWTRSTSTIHKNCAASGKHPRKPRSIAEKIQVKLPHQRSPYAMTFEDRSQEEIERQERCAGGDARRRAKNIYKLKEKDKATFFSLADEWSLPAASKLNRRKESFWWTPELACIWSARKTLTLPNWRP